MGDKKKVVVAPAEGYGEMNPELKLAVNRSQFPPTTELEAGMQFQANAGGQSVVFTVEKIEGDKVHIDGNHPLAGQTLHFDVEVLSVRDATEEEKNTATRTARTAMITITATITTMSTAKAAIMTTITTTTSTSTNKR